MSMEEYYEIQRIRDTSIINLTEKDFRKLPHRPWDADIGYFDSIIILPAKRDYIGEIKYRIARWWSNLRHTEAPELWRYINHLHDSNFYCMDFVAVRNEKPVCLLSGCSDVIHIEGIGGYGKNWIHKGMGVPTQIRPAGWTMDCLPKSRLLRLWAFSDSGSMSCGPALSSFEVFSNSGMDANQPAPVANFNLSLWSQNDGKTNGKELYEMPDKKTEQDIIEVLDRGIDPTAPARIADELEAQGKKDSAGWLRVHLAEYFAEVLNGAFKKYLKGE